MAELSAAEKKVFLDATNRRKAAGIKLKRITLLAEESQVIGFNELWESWVLRWGKEGAMDRLIRVMATVEARVRDQENAK